MKKRFIKVFYPPDREEYIKKYLLNHADDSENRDHAIWEWETKDFLDEVLNDVNHFLEQTTVSLVSYQLLKYQVDKVVFLNPKECTHYRVVLCYEKYS